VKEQVERIGRRLLELGEVQVERPRLVVPRMDQERPEAEVSWSFWSRTGGVSASSDTAASFSAVEYRRGG